jgi:glucose/arabinose dehydrogenase
MPTLTRSFILAWRSMLCTVAVTLSTPARAVAATVPAGFAETIVATGLRQPTAMAFAPDGRLFVCEQTGTLRVISSSGSLLPTPFVTVATTAAGERGLLGVAFDPDFAANHFVYVYYTATTPNVHNRVSRFTANGNVAAAGSEFVVVDLEPLGATNHNGGAIHFGPDRKLFIAVGENANRNNAQTLENRLGKILRINSDGSIPDDNPFAAVATGANRAIWALGLRNPFTFAFRPFTDIMFINDVGENTWEEINQGSAGANYGWPVTEGPTADTRFVSPLFAYTHSNFDGVIFNCAISGGAFYDPLVHTFPAEFNGSYFFADLCGGVIRRRAADSGVVTIFATGLSSPVDLHVSEAGSLYYLARGAGQDTGVVVRVDARRPPALTLTANGVHGTIQLNPQDSLTITLTFDAGSAGVMTPGEIYIAANTPLGLLWLDPASQQFSFLPRPVATGPIPSFGPVTLFQFPSLAGVPPGSYVWAVVVDNDSNGVVNGTLVDAIGTIIQ